LRNKEGGEEYLSLGSEELGMHPELEEGHYFWRKMRGGLLV
jgi:hypothetical protein